MTLYVVQDQQLKAVPTTSFAQEGLLERKHLQAMLHRDPSPLGEDLLVLREEFGQWQDSQRRIDLLCLDKGGSLVVVELKRTADGGHMDLQAIRYAAMVSSRHSIRQLPRVMKRSVSIARSTRHAAASLNSWNWIPWRTLNSRETFASS